MAKRPGNVGLVEFREALYDCLTRWGDALYELADAGLCSAGPIGSVPTLSLEPQFTRSHGSLYKALARGRIDEDGLRRLLVASRPIDWPMVFAVDASTWDRCDAECSPERVLLLGVQALGRPAHRGRLVVPVDLPTVVYPRQLDRTRGRPAHHPQAGRDRCHRRPDTPTGRPCSFRS